MDRNKNGLGILEGIKADTEYMMENANIRLEKLFEELREMREDNIMLGRLVNTLEKEVDELRRELDDAESYIEEMEGLIDLNNIDTSLIEDVCLDIYEELE